MSKVATGMRNAASSEPVNADDLVKPKPLRFTAAEGEAKKAYPTRFQSKCQHLIITLNFPVELQDGAMRDRKVNVTFSGGFVDLERQRYTIAPRLISEGLQKCEGYGLGKTFWDAEEFAKNADENALASFIDQARALAQDPAKREALKAVLADDFDLPSVPADPKAD